MGHSTITTPKASVVWFRNDLRLSANPALSAAARAGNPVICLYVLEDGPYCHRLPGGARKWWLNKSLQSLKADLQELGGDLILRRSGSKTTKDVVLDFVSEVEATKVFWNRRYAPQETETDKAIKSHLSADGVEVKSFNGSLLCEPWDVKTNGGDPYRVFTPFWKSLKDKFEPRHPESKPDLKFCEGVNSDDLQDWDLHPSKPDWSNGLESFWTPGESGAKEQLARFIDEGLRSYKSDRDRPDKMGTSLMSPFLSFGEISPQFIWRAVQSHLDQNNALEEGGWSFLREIAWRDFSHNLLYQSDSLHEKNWNDRFNKFDWLQNETLLLAWQKGQTGYPMVDAGMRQLWETGWMHNRVRMIVGSFLVKHLLIDWREGERWFWDTLVDADTANNPASWQWVAGSGADAAPYFRIFNPMTQGSKFDPDGAYVRKWVPELRNLPVKYIHAPWEAPRDVLASANIRLGQTYPKPIVDHKSAREAALEAYERTN